MIEGKLFEAVQSAQLFDDDKVFVDAVPKGDVPEYTGGDLKEFVEKHFVLPKTEEEEVVCKTMEEHIEKMWDVLRRPMKTEGTLIGLPNPDIVPGGRFRECYYWDSYFIAVGLMQTGRERQVREMVENFAYLIDTYGFIPNGNRTYYLSRSQQPYFARMLKLIEGVDFFPQLEREYAFWMSGVAELTGIKPRVEHAVLLDDDLVLNRYYDRENVPRPEAYNADKAVYEQASEEDRVSIYRHLRAACESGWDFSSRWLRDHTNLTTICTCDILPIDLNCLLFECEELLATYAKARGDIDRSLQYDRAAEIRKRAIQRYFWNQEKEFFFDYHFTEKHQTDTWSLAGIFPLFSKIATQEQADKVAEHISYRFKMTGGLKTTTTRSGQQWDAPNGWAPLQWIAVQGLLNYNHHDLAQEISQDWVAMCRMVFKNTHKMLEKYNVVDSDKEALTGAYSMQDGFGWTNGIVSAFL